jgi:hypothetical protein
LPEAKTKYKKHKNRMNKVKSVSLFCALLSVGSAIADPGPILSEDGKTFQLNFPPVIVDELNRFVSMTEEQNQKNYEVFPYEVTPHGDGSVCNKVGICEPFVWTAEAMMSHFRLKISQEEFESRMSDENRAGVAKTLLELNNKKISLLGDSAVYVQIALSYFLNSFYQRLANQPISQATCVSTACWLKLLALKRGDTRTYNILEAIDQYRNALRCLK